MRNIKFGLQQAMSNIFVLKGESLVDFASKAYNNSEAVSLCLKWEENLVVFPSKANILAKFDYTHEVRLNTIHTINQCATLTP